MISEALVIDNSNFFKNGTIRVRVKKRTYSDFALYVSSPDIKSLEHKTTHTAYVEEFENALVVLGEEANIKFLTEPKFDGIKDEQRVYYVAVSRAAKRLAICVPTLSQENENTLSTLPIKIVRL